MTFPKTLIFIHIPRTGGTSVRNALMDNSKPAMSKGHNIAQLGKDSHGKNWSEIFSFCFVRNPWDHILSWYCFHQEMRAYLDGFEKWILNGLPHHWGDDWRTKTTPDDPLNQLLYFQDEDCKDIVQFVGQFENLSSDLNHALSLAGHFPINISHTNASKHENYRQYYTDQTREMIATRYSKFIERFGYEF